MTSSESSEVREYQRQVALITWLGLACNVLLAAGKIAAGVLGHSRAVLADGVHSLTDLATDLAVLIGVRFWSRPADENHPHGHQRIETLVTLAIALALAVTALGLGYDGLSSIRNKDFHKPGWIAFGAAMASLVVKEILFQVTRKKARMLNSSALMANAWHHRSDAFSSIPAALAVAVGALFPDWAFVDSIGALIVCLLILKASMDIAWPALNQLSDRAAPPEATSSITSVILATPGVVATHAVRTRYLGSSLQVDCHVMVEPEITVRQGHDIAKAVRERLINDDPNVGDLNIVDVVVHVEPVEEPGSRDDKGRSGGT